VAASCHVSFDEVDLGGRLRKMDTNSRKMAILTDK